MSRTLDVFIDSTLVGQLTDENNIWSFQYHPNWLASEHIRYHRHCH